jgi:hypothetical protein
VALQGTLQDFGALETFQLIALQQKTGTLEITHGNRQRRFVFENGLLLAAHEAPLKPEDPLVRFLVEMGYLQEQDLPAWLGLTGGQPVNQIDLLVKMARLSEDDVVQAYDLFLQTILDEILAWPQGRFQFHSGRLDAPSKIVGPWKIEAVLMESMRRLDELADLQAAEVPPGLVARVLDPAAVALIEDRFSRAVIKSIDGKRSLQDVTSGSSLAPYDIYQALRQMRDQGLVEMIEWVPTGPWMESFWQKRSWARMVLFAMAAPALLALLTLGIRTALERYPSPWHTGPGASYLTPEARASQAGYTAALLLETYRLRTGHYPETAAQLAENGLITSAAARRLDEQGPRWEAAAAGHAYRWVPAPQPARGRRERKPSGT